MLNIGKGFSFLKLFQSIDFTKPDIYYDANKYNKDFVEL